MKKFFLFNLIFLFCLNLHSQIIPGRPNYVNPDKYLFFRFNDKVRENTMDPRLTDSRFYIKYNIYDSMENLIFSEEKNNFFEPGKELFFTEDTLFDVSIPMFEWKGELNVKNNKITEVYGQARDGEYQLRIIMETKIAGWLNNYRENLSTHRIIVDTTPPDFIPYFYPFAGFSEKSDNDAFLLFIYTGGETADRWKIEINGVKTGNNYLSSLYYREDRLPVITFKPQDEDCIAEITAIDRAQNQKTMRLTLPSKSSYLNSENKKSSEDDDALKINKQLLSDIENYKKIIAELEKLRSGDIRSGDRAGGIQKLSDLKIMSDEPYPYLDVPDITFTGSQYSSLMIENSRDNIQKIKLIFDMIYPLLNEFNYLHIHGFANPLERNSSESARKAEEENVLLPLSQKRAEYIKNIFILMGIPGEKIKPEGRGGSYFRADPHNNSENWKNRIVRFYLD